MPADLVEFITKMANESWAKTIDSIPTSLQNNKDILDTMKSTYLLGYSRGFTERSILFGSRAQSMQEKTK